LSKLKYIIFLVISIGLISGCTNDSNTNSDTTQTEIENPYGGFPIPPPADDEIILTVSGASTVEFSLDDLRALPKIEITVIEPFVLREQTFEGVFLSEIFQLAGIGPNELVDTIALNEYRYQDRSDALVEAQAVLAYSVDGSVIDMDKGGPIRLVFAQDSNYFTFLDAWNWSLREISVSQE
jgi:hypothetical protein